jgi:hypothetical protein
LSQNVSAGTYPVDNAVFEVNHNMNYSYTSVLDGLYWYALSSFGLVGNNSLMFYVNDSVGNNVWSVGEVFTVLPTTMTTCTTTTTSTTTTTTTKTTTTTTTTPHQPRLLLQGLLRLLFRAPVLTALRTTGRRAWIVVLSAIKHVVLIVQCVVGDYVVRRLVIQLVCVVRRGRVVM